MARLFALALMIALLGACGQKAPDRPDKKANERLDSIEARLDAAELADPAVPVDAAISE